MLAVSRREFLFATLAMAATCLPRRADARANPLCVIVAASAKQQEISLSQLRRIFMNQPTDDQDGHRFIPINTAPRTVERMTFDSKVLGMDADDIARYWIDQRIRGGQPPRTTNSFSVILGVVARLPGAISYVPQHLLTPQVKALRLDGKLPTDAGYLVV